MVKAQRSKMEHDVSSEAIKLQLDELQEATVWMESSINHLAQTYLSERKAMDENHFESSKLTFEKITDLNGKRYAVIKSTSPLGFTIQHYIDYESGLEARRFATIKKEGEPHTVEIIYFYKNLSESIEMGDALMPSSYLLKVNDFPYYSVKFQTIRTNPGLTDALFTDK